MFQLLLSIKKSAALVLFSLLCTSMNAAQQPAIDLTAQSLKAFVSIVGMTETEPPVMAPMPSEILKKFVATEERFRETIREYTFRRDVVLQTISPDGKITGEYLRNSQFVLDDRGGRVERVIYHPKSTIREMKITKEDIQDLACAQLFGFEFTDVKRYDITYLGQETFNSRQTYAIEVNPKQPANPRRMRERFFVGRIWIDSLSFQIVKMRGITVPQGKQRFPTFETLREKSAGSDFLFPTSTFADDVLHFPGRDVHYRITVKYYDYKLFASRVSIVEIDQPASVR